MKRCAWVANATPLMLKYHDEEWGLPVHDDNKLFEAIVLDGAQAGLSWNTVLNKREAYRKAFAGFNPKKVASFNEKDEAALLQNEGIIRNRLKIRSAINNASRFLEVQKEFGSFDTYLWSFVNNKPIQNNFKTLKDLPARTDLSDEISLDLKKRGFNFVGSTIIYAMMQAIGMVNDHTTDCYRHKQLI
ncbi:DNA-3-methyladenine glycosylase I [Candidatus Micrarchaeota archaeon]|nr:DNA-3-methyladenine glycosylase I [Candidatus Micrarchaeota archaeon]